SDCGGRSTSTSAASQTAAPWSLRSTPASEPTPLTRRRSSTPSSRTSPPTSFPACPRTGTAGDPRRRRTPPSPGGEGGVEKQWLLLEREAELAEQSTTLVVVGRGGDDGDVHTTRAVDLVDVDLVEHGLLREAEGVV